MTCGFDHMRRVPRTWLVVLASVAGSVLTTGVGCGPRGARVEGVVTLDGQPLSGAMLMFFPTGAEGRTAAVQADQDGRYRLVVSPHPMRVVVSAQKVVRQVKDGDGMADVLEERVPARYSDASSRELSVEPVAGSVTTADFSLTSSKR